MVWWCWWRDFGLGLGNWEPGPPRICYCPWGCRHRLGSPADGESATRIFGSHSSRIESRRRLAGAATSCRSFPDPRGITNRFPHGIFPCFAAVVSVPSGESAIDDDQVLRACWMGTCSSTSTNRAVAGHRDPLCTLTLCTTPC